MTHLCAFSGIGGFSLACRWAGFETLAHCEIEPYCQKVLAKNFPGVPCCADIHDLAEWFVRRFGDRVVDLFTFGFPCQDVSDAGKGAGLSGSRSGLFFAALGVIQQLRPRFIVGENVRGILSKPGMGGASAIETVVACLREAGYTVEVLILGAGSVGAPHRRDRVFLVGERNDLADADRTGLQSDDPRRYCRDGASTSAEALGRTVVERGVDGPGPVPDTESQQCKRAWPAWRRRTRFADLGGTRVGVAQGDSDGSRSDGDAWRLSGEFSPDGHVESVPGRTSGVALGNATDDRCGQQRAAGATAAQLGAAELAGADIETAGCGDISGRCVGREPDGISDRLDGSDGEFGGDEFFIRWPAGYGVSQYDWEPSRLVEPKSVPNRRARLHALGNAVVPQQACVIVAAVAERLYYLQSIGVIA